jgi:hypothetical protein
MKSNFESKEKFMELSLETIEVLNEDEYLLVRGGKSSLSSINNGNGCGCGPINNGNGCGCALSQNSK